MFRFYSRLAAMPDTRLAGFIFRKRCLEVDAGEARHSWCKRLFQQLQAFGVDRFWGRPLPRNWDSAVGRQVHRLVEANITTRMLAMSSLSVFRRVGRASLEGWLDRAAKHPGAWLRLKLRCGGAPLMETVGASNGIPREERTCKMCAVGAIETAEHFVSECAFYQRERQQSLERIRGLVAGHDSPQLRRAIDRAEMELFLGDGLLRALPAEVARRVDAALCDYLKVAWRKRQGVWKNFSLGDNEWKLKDGS